MKPSVMFHGLEDEVREGAPLSSQHCSSSESNTNTRNAEQKCVREAPFPAHRPWILLLCVLRDVPRKSQACRLCTCSLKNLSSQQSWSTLVLWSTSNFAQNSWPDMPADSCRCPRFGVDSAQLSPAAVEWVVGQGWNLKNRWCENENKHCSHLG